MRMPWWQSAGAPWVERRFGSVVIANDSSSPWTHGLVEFDDVRCGDAGGGGCLTSPRVGSGHRNQVFHPAAEDVTQSRQQLQRNALGALMNDAIERGRTR